LVLIHAELVLCLLAQSRAKQARFWVPTAITPGPPHAATSH
jgi:hypothetical protein